MKNGALVAVGLAAVAVVYLMMKKTAVPPPTYGLGNVGSTAHVPVSAAGVALAGILGQSLSGWFGGGATSPGQVPADTNTPFLGNGTISNPVYPSPTVLPYSYKQQTIDTPTLLGTDQLFTPSYDGSGSSGGYSEDSNSSDILNYGF